MTVILIYMHIQLFILKIMNIGFKIPSKTLGLEGYYYINYFFKYSIASLKLSTLTISKSYLYLFLVIIASS